MQIVSSKKIISNKLIVMETIYKKCEYCGEDYVVSEREWYFEHNGKGGVDIVGECNCGIKDVIKGLSKKCSQCAHCWDNGCRSEERIKEYKEEQGLEHCNIPYIRLPKEETCSHFLFEGNAASDIEGLECLKRCFSCSFNYKGKCCSPVRISDVMVKVKEYELPISSLSLIDQHRDRWCNQHKISKEYIKKISKLK